MESLKNLEELNEEFNNFMHRVTEVTNIVKKLSSNDKTMQDIGTLEADSYLKEKDTTLMEKIDEENVKLKIKADKSVINWKALKKNEDPNTMSQEAFMEQISKDADRRYRDKLVRKEKSETFRKQGTLAFRRGEYERALTCYNKAIEQIRDSCQLYLDRCLTEVHLELYDKAVEDAKTALKLNEDSLKAWLLLAKAYYKKKCREDFENCLKEAKERNPKYCSFINEYAESLEKDNNKEDI